LKLKFIDPMECVAVSKLPDGPDWIYEIKLDGYRAEAIRTADGVEFYSRNGKSLAKKFPYIVEALSDLPADTIVDGELVALDDLGRPVFNLLQNFKGEAARIRYFAFDLLRLKDRDLTSLPLIERKSLLVEVIGENDRVKISEHMEVLANTMLAAIKEQGLEGVVAKRKDSVYEPGLRTGAWSKIRVNLGREFVIGGYIPGPHGLDSIVVGYHRDDELIYVARVRNGFCSCESASCVSANQKFGGTRVPLRKAARGPKGSLGRGRDDGEDEGMRMGSTGVGSTDTLPRMD
jgi:ATP-dependent DNA ligase